MSGDLFQLVYEKRRKDYTSFWGKYSYLNVYSHEKMNDRALFIFQLSRLKTRESLDVNFIHVNKFLNEILQSKPDANQEMTLNDISIRILELLNAGLISSGLNPKNVHMIKNGNGGYSYKPGSSNDSVKADTLALIGELQLLSDMIQSSRTDARVKRLGHAIGGLGITKTSLNDEYENYNSYKANEAEILMVEILNKYKGWRAIQSGQFYYNSQQLLEDAFVFDTTINIDFGGSFTATKANKGSKKGSGSTVSVSNLQEFFDLVDSLKINESLHLSDELYEKIQEIKLFAAQAKSGVGLQHLLNETKERNSISLNQIGNQKILSDLYYLYMTYWIDPEAESKTLEALANFWLSKSITSTNIIKNEIYFTKDGFVTASQWMKTYEQMLKFNPPIRKIMDSFGTHPYVFKKVG